MRRIQLPVIKSRVLADGISDSRLQMKERRVHHHVYIHHNSRGYGALKGLSGIPLRTKHRHRRRKAVIAQRGRHTDIGDFPDKARVLGNVQNFAAAHTDDNLHILHADVFCQLHSAFKAVLLYEIKLALWQIALHLVQISAHNRYQGFLRRNNRPLLFDSRNTIRQNFIQTLTGSLLNKETPG